MYVIRHSQVTDEHVIKAIEGHQVLCGVMDKSADLHRQMQDLMKALAGLETEAPVAFTEVQARTRYVPTVILLGKTGEQEKKATRFLASRFYGEQLYLFTSVMPFCGALSTSLFTVRVKSPPVCQQPVDTAFYVSTCASLINLLVC